MRSRASSGTDRRRTSSSMPLTSRQEERQEVLNGHLGLKATEHYCRAEPEAHGLLEHALERFGFSARAYHRILRVARTIAVLAGEKKIQTPQIAEAIQYRAFDRISVKRD